MNSKRWSYRIKTEFLKKYIDQNGCISKTILDVEADLTNICWLPILDSYIQPDDWELFHRLWNQDKTPMTHAQGDALWESLCIWKNQDIAEEQIIHNDFPQKVVDWSKIFPKMFSQLFAVMPFSEIWKITIATNFRRVPAHVDRPSMIPGKEFSEFESLHPWPNCVRVMLFDTNPVPTFYVTPWPEELLNRGKIKKVSSVEEWVSLVDPKSDKKCYVQLPKNSNTFVFSNGAFMHGADFAQKEKILLLIWGRPDPKPWKEKLREILKNYPDYKTNCMFSE